MAQWPGTIQERQMFFNLKRKYPNMPDEIVSQCLAKAGGDERAAEEHLESTENSKYHIGKTSNVPHVDKSPDVAGAAALPSSGFRCPITRYVPKSPIRPPVNITYNNGASSHMNSVSPHVEQSLESTRIHDLIQRQLRNKRNLEVELKKQYDKYDVLKRRVAELKSQLNENQASEKIKSLSREISTLQRDCEKLNAEVDELTSVGEARGPINRTQVRITAMNGGDGIYTEAWHCEMCTFRNHHLLNQCETCCMPRINVGINAV